TGALVAHRFGTGLVLGGLLGAAGGGAPVVLPGQLQAHQRGRTSTFALVRATVVEAGEHPGDLLAGGHRVRTAGGGARLTGGPPAGPDAQLPPRPRDRRRSRRAPGSPP